MPIAHKVKVFMRRLLLVLTVFCWVGSVHAQKQPPISCDEIVKLGFDKFRTSETARTGDESTAGMVAISDRYTKCKREANDRAVKALSAARQKQVATARRELDKLENAIWTMMYLREGGGTMYSQFEAIGYGLREDTLARLIGTLQIPPAPSSFRMDARGRINRLWQQSERSLERYSVTPNFKEANSLGAPVQQRRLYANAARQARTSWHALRVLSKGLSDAAATAVTERATGVFIKFSWGS